MKKCTVIICVVLSLACLLCSCTKKGEPINLTEAPELTDSTTEITTGSEDSAPSDEITEDIDNTETAPQESKTPLEELEDSEVVTYYCADPNNKYISGVADKYGVDKSVLVALIRTKAKNPGATVLEFSGKTDSSGNLLTTEEELRAVYEISETDSTVKKATGKISGYDGCTYVENMAIYKLTEEFIVPSLDEMKKERPYKGH